tara:strand:+ start:42 stop:710 length:669 start_codon:yes stop_codon:yes gene_type:complete
MGKIGNYISSGEYVDENPLMEFEADYWGNCCNTLDEESKQFCYAKLMGINKFTTYSFTVGGKKILDIGGGPTSILLKTHDHKDSKVVDPLKYPEWTIERYKANNIEYVCKSGEDFDETGYDEVWIYNCLQHVLDPQKIIENAKKAAPVLRIFEWIDIPAHKGHPHELKEDKLNEWIGGIGKTGQMKYSEFSTLYEAVQPILTERIEPGSAFYYGEFNHKVKA